MSKSMSSEERLTIAMACGQADRVPCAPLHGQYPGRFAGITNAEYLWDLDKQIAANRALKETYPMWDAAEYGHYAPSKSRISRTKTLFPGRELGPNAEYQVAEREVMSVEEYNILIQKGLDEYQRVNRLRALGIDETEVAKGFALAGEYEAAIMEEYRKMGMALLWAGATDNPLDIFYSTRSFMGCIVDMVEESDILEEALEAATRDIPAPCIAMCRQKGVNRVMIGCSRSSTQFLKPEWFERFSWPYLKRIVLTFIDAGITPVLHCDTNWDAGMEYFLQFPEKKVVIELDSTSNIFRAKEILHGHCCLMGDVPATMFAFGSPTEVEDYCKRLLTQVGKDGGFILSSGCSVPINAKHENIRAFFTSVEKYGRYD